MNKFAFLIHPIEVQDFYKRFPLLKKAPSILVENLATTISPFKLSQIKGIQTPKGEIEGYFIFVPFTTRKIFELSEERVLKKLLKACKIAQGLEVNIIGLGGFTSTIGNEGVILSENFSIPITTGYTYSVVTAIDGIKKVVQGLGKEFKECEILVVGENTSISHVVVRYLAREAKYLTLASKNKEKSEVLFEEILQQTGTVIHISQDIDSAMKRGDILFITDTIDNSHLKSIKKEAFICDLSNDKKVTIELKKSRQDLFFVDGGILTLPTAVELGEDLEISSNRCSPSLVETILLTLEERWECFSLGKKLELEKMDRIKKLAEENNIQLTGVSSLYKEIFFGKRNSLDN